MSSSVQPSGTRSGRLELQTTRTSGQIMTTFPGKDILAGRLAGIQESIAGVYRTSKESVTKTEGLKQRIAGVFRFLKLNRSNLAPGKEGKLDLAGPRKAGVIGELAKDFAKAWQQDKSLTAHEYKKAVERQFNRLTCRFSLDESGTRQAVTDFKNELFRALEDTLAELTKPGGENDRRQLLEQEINEVVEKSLSEEKQSFESLHGNLLAWKFNGNNELSSDTSQVQELSREVQTENEPELPKTDQLLQEELDGVVNELRREEAMSFVKLQVKYLKRKPDGHAPEPKQTTGKEEPVKEQPVETGSGRRSVHSEDLTIWHEGEPEELVENRGEYEGRFEEVNPGGEGEETIVAQLPEEMLSFPRGKVES